MASVHLPFDILVCLIMWGTFFVAALSLGKRRTLTALISLLIAVATLSAAEGVLLLLPEQTAVVAFSLRAAILAALWLLGFTALKDVFNAEYPPVPFAKWLQALLMSGALTFLLLLSAYTVAPLQKLYNFSPLLDTVFNFHFSGSATDVPWITNIIILLVVFFCARR